MDTPYTPSNQTPQPDPQPPQSPSRPTDPGTPFSGFIALSLTIIFAGGVILWQNLPESTQYGMFNEAVPQTPITADTPAPGRFGQFDLPARMFIRGHKLLTELDSSQQSGSMSETVMSQFVAVYDPEDQIRTIIMSGEYEGPEQALDRIEATRIEVIDRIANKVEQEGAVTETPDSNRYGLLLTELDTLQSIYTDGPDSVEQPMRDQLVARYGILGQAALTHGMDDDDPRRKPLVTGFGWVATLLFFMLALVGFSFLAGIVLLVIGIVNLASGKLRFRYEPPAPGGSVFLETYGLFVAAFAVLSIGLFVLSIKVNPSLGVLSFPLQWVLMLVPAWALLRGMKSRAWRQAIGLHTGEGVLKEIGCGFLVYLASIPIFMVGLLITIVVVIVQSLRATAQGLPPTPPTNPIFEIISDSGPFVILLVFSLATIWAPITEELIFRGALYRHMRGRLHWVLAAFFSAILFAYMHSYGPLMVAPLIALGFMFAFMRQWRGSIIAPITAHFIHNATLVGFMIIFISLLKDPVI